MKPKTTGTPRAQKPKSLQGEGGPNWILIAGGALLSTLSIRLGYKLKQAIDTKQQENVNNGSKGLQCVRGQVVFPEFMLLTFSMYFCL